MHNKLVDIKCFIRYHRYNEFEHNINTYISKKKKSTSILNLRLKFKWCKAI